MRRSTRSTAVSARTSGAVRSPRSTAVNTAPASMASAARASRPTSARSCAPSRSSRAITASISEKQFRRYYAEAIRLKGDIGENLIGLLERRLDAVIYRAKFVPTVFAARQFVNHGHVTVNGKRVNIAVLPGQAGRRDRGEGSLASSSPSCSKPPRSPSATCPTTSRSTTPSAGHLRPHPDPVGRALPGADGTEPGHRVLLALIRLRPTGRTLANFGGWQVSAIPFLLRMILLCSTRDSRLYRATGAALLACRCR